MIDDMHTPINDSGMELSNSVSVIDTENGKLYY